MVRLNHLKAAERVYGLVKAFARCLVDHRAPEKIRHTLEDLVGQRVFGIACGHPDWARPRHPGNVAGHPRREVAVAFWPKTATDARGRNRRAPGVAAQALGRRDPAVLPVQHQPGSGTRRSACSSCWSFSPITSYRDPASRHTRAHQACCEWRSSPFPCAFPRCSLSMRSGDALAIDGRRAARPAAPLPPRRSPAWPPCGRSVRSRRRAACVAPLAAARSCPAGSDVPSLHHRHGGLDLAQPLGAFGLGFATDMI